jgi:dienelactone hydrolase
MKIKFVLLFSLLTLFALTLFSSEKNTPLTIPVNGIYDGIVGEQKIILIAEESNQYFQKGYFVINEEKAVEETHSYTLEVTGKKLIFRSDIFAGKLKGISDSTSFDGTIFHYNKKKKFLFFYQKDSFKLSQRTDKTISPSLRYQKEIFKEVLLTKNIKYGTALGYWTKNPYNNEPYIEFLTKGISNSMKDPDSLDLRLDLYQPNNDTLTNRPLVLLIHGGAFYVGTRQIPTIKLLATALAKRGFVVASIDYRLGFKLTTREIERSGFRAVQDAHAALRFLSHNADQYRIDPNQVYVGGTSAGAIASLNVAFMDNDERPENVMSNKKSEDMGRIESSGNNFTDQFQIKAVASMWGAVYDINIIDDDERIPVLSIHGTADDIVPFDYDYPFKRAFLVNRIVMNKIYGSKPIHDRLNSMNVRNKLIALEGQNHEPQVDKFDNFTPFMDTIENNVTEFFYEETAPEIFFPEKQLSISKNATSTPFYAEISNGEFVTTSVVGGVKRNSNPKDLSIIWFKNSYKHEISIYTKNQFDAWNFKTYPITITQ